MLGRWKREGSDTYVRMYNGVVTRLQQQFNHAARRNDRFRVLDERDILEAVAWMTHRMSWWEDDQIRHVIQHLEESMKLAPGIVWELPDENHAQQFQESHLQTTAKKLVADAPKERAERSSIFVVVQTSQKCRRLRKSDGGCWMGRQMNFKNADEYVVMPNSSQHTNVCKVCWPSTKEKCEISSSSGSTSTSDTDSSSSE